MIILTIAAFLRLYNLEAAPGWFLDEGLYFDVARNLRDGERLAGQMEVTFASPYMTAPPVWFLAEAIWMGVFGETMTSFRLFTALCGVVCVGLVAGITRRLANPQAGLWAAAFLAVAPRAVLYSRMAIPYTPAATLLLLWIFATLQTEQHTNRAFKRALWFGVAILAAILAPLTLYYAVALIPAALIWRIAKGYQRFRRAKQKQSEQPPKSNSTIVPTKRLFPTTLLFSAICGGLGLLAFFWSGHHFWSERFPIDFERLRNNVSSAPLFAGRESQIKHWTDYLFRWGGYPSLGFLGFLLLRRRAATLSIVALTVGLAHLVLRRADAIITFIDYPMMAGFPLLCIGVGALIGRGPGLIRGIGLIRSTPRLQQRLTIIAVLFCVALAARSALAIQTEWKHRWVKPTLAFGMLESLQDAKKIAHWANQSIQQSENPKGRLILASTNLWPLLDVPHADANQLMAARGQGSGFYEYPCVSAAKPALQKEMIRIFIEDSFTEHRRSTLETFPDLPPENPWVQLAEAIHTFHTTWPLAYQKGAFSIRARPDL